MKRRQFVKTIGTGAAALGFTGGIDRLMASVAAGQAPNILFIMADDHAAHAMSCYGSRINKTPGIDRMAREGLRFTDCLCTNGICAPSRAVILTGKYSHINGVRDNVAAFDGAQPTFPKMLREAGYRTGLIGKWHLKSDPTGFDYWNILPGQGDYYNPDMIEMGKTTTREGYVTDILTDLAVEYLNGRRDSGRPFLLMLHHKAPHRNWQPAPRHLTLYDGVTFAQPETLFDDYATRSAAAREQEMSVAKNLDPLSDLKMGPPPGRLNDAQRKAWDAAYGPKKERFSRRPPKEGKELVLWKYQRYMEDYLACVAAVDESTRRVLEHLDRTGLAANTLVAYTSDQGFFLGDHGWFDKRFMYEESLRMPLLMRLPGTIPAGTNNAELVSNLDFGPTFLDLAGVTKPAGMQGESFAAFLRGRKIPGWRESFYYHYYEFPAVHMVKRHYGLRTKRYKLIHFYYDIDAWELYDLEKDPHELRNVYDDPAYAAVRAEMTAELRRKQSGCGDSDELARRFVEADLKNAKRVP
jgi:arylsulfatase A-like enzyme